MSKIEWTGKTWNPTIGCTECSRGCMNCYAAKMAFRLMHIPSQKETYAGIAKKLPNGMLVFTGLVRELPERLQQPFNNKKPTVYFVDSMSDLFHADVSWNFQYKVFEMMLLTPRHTYQVLTKRPDIAKKVMPDIYFHLSRNYPDKFTLDEPMANVWAGVSCEDQKTLDERMPYHLSTPWHTHFLSYEPAVGAIDLFNVKADGHQLFGFDEHTNQSYEHFCALDIVGAEGFEYCLDWVICGGESGTGRNIQPMHPEWARNVRDQCSLAGIPFFFKQWGRFAPIDQPHSQNNILPLAKNERWLNADGGSGFHGEEVWRVRDVGKHAAGHLLDGVEHFNLPNINK